MIGILLAATLGLAPQEAPAPPEDPIALENIVVTGRPLADMIGDFVGEVAAPNGRRGLARWRTPVCVGVANLQAEPAQYLADRVSTVAEDLGVRTGSPGCTPNILIVATANGGELARTLVAERPRAFRMGGSGMDRGGVALRRFQEDHSPVRWWQMAIPVDGITGDRAVRIPGECNNSCTETTDAAPVLSPFGASRLNNQLVDNLTRAIVIVDFEQLPEGMTILQLADYIAMVTLAQIDPQAETSTYASILNVMDDREAADSLTSWDLAYLEGLYNAEGGSRNRRSDQADVSRSIGRAHARLRAADASETEN